MHIAINGLFLQHPHTGTGQYTLHLLEALAAQEDGHTYTIFVDPGGYRPANLGDAVRFQAGYARNLPTSALRKLHAEQIGFPLACRRAGVQVAHVPYFAPPLVKACPTVTTIHDLITLLLPEYSGGAPSRRFGMAVAAYNRLVSAAARRADAIIADSEHSKRDIVRVLGIPEERVHVIYLAAEERFRPITRAGDLAGVRQRYGLPEDFIFYIGGLNRHKNVAALLQAFAALQDRLPRPYTLAIAGRAHSDNPAVFPDLSKIARELGLSVDEGGRETGSRDRQSEIGNRQSQIRFLRFVPEEDKPLLYNAARLFVFPSLYEGFGLTPLEAMACGAPLVCSRAASLPEIVGDGGLLVDPTSPADLAEAMLAALTNEALRNELRARGLAQAARFSWAKTAGETLNVYERVI